MIDIRSLRDLVRLYYIFRGSFAIAFWLTVALIVAGAFFLPTKYASDARLLVRPGRENLTVPIDVTDRQSYTPLSTQRDPIIDDEKMLTGQPVANQVAGLYLSEINQTKMPAATLWQKIKDKLKGAAEDVLEAWRSLLVMAGLTEPRTPQERLAEKFEDKFSVTHGVGSNVMELHFVWDDPSVAQRVLQTWIRVYTDERTAALGRKNLVTFYEAKVGDTDQQIESLKGLMRTRLEQISGLSASERLTAITKRLNELRDRRAEITAERTALEQGVAFAQGQHKSLSADVVTEREVGLSPSWTALSNQIAELKRQRADALRVYQASAPAVTSLSDSIAAMESQLQAEQRDTARAEKLTPNELGTMLSRNELEKSMHLRELVSMQASVDKELNDLSAARQSVLEHEPELDRLDQQLQVAERSRLLYLDNLEKAKIDQALDDSRINNIAVIEAATLNPARVWPKSLLLLGLALPAGLLVGVLTLYVLALSDQRIHDGGRIEARFGVPLWSSVKDVALSGQDNDFHASLHRIYGTLPLQRIAEHGLVLGLASSRAGEGVSFLAQQLAQVCRAQGLSVRLNPELSQAQARAGELTLLEASDLLRNRDAFIRLSHAQLIVLVVEARASLVPVVENALGVLQTAFRKVDGIVLNRRRFEVPPRVLRWLRT